MATYTWVDLDIPEASMLANLYGISMDIDTAQRFAKQMLAELSTEKPNCSLIEPFSIAIVVTYTHPFQDGVRHRLNGIDLAILTPDLRKAHDYLYAYRNKHVAHSRELLRREPSSR
jgi:hypothetical protein